MPTAKIKQILEKSEKDHITYRSFCYDVSNN